MTYFEEMKEKFWMASNIVEEENLQAVKNWAANTYEQIQDDVQAMAAFVIVLNHKCWYWYEIGMNTLSQIYSDLYYKYNDIEWDWLEKHGTEEEKTWYFRTLD